MSDTAPRVVMVSRLFHPWIGGTERQASTLASGLRRRGVEVTIVTGRWFRGTSRHDVVGDVEVFRNHTMFEGFGVRGARTLSGYLYMATLGWYLWRNRAAYDVVHVHGMNYHSAVAVAVGRLTGRPVVTKLANSGAASDIVRMREGRQLRGAGRFLPVALRSDRFVALSDVVAEELTRAGVPGERIVRIPNGVDAEAIRPGPARSAPRPGSLRLVYVGRLHAQKSLDTLIEAVAAMDRRHPGSVHVGIVGDGPERDALAAAVRARGLTGVVDLPGPSDDVPGVLAGADCFVLPSTVEGLSNALLEAMAAGRAVVVSDIRANTAVVRDGETGLVFSVGDHVALSGVLERLVAEPGLVEELGRRARALVEREYSLDRVVSRYIELYRTLAEGAT